jgi:hypothetical protein
VRPGGGPPSFRKSRYGPTIAQHGALRRGAGLLIRWQPVLTGFNPAGTVTKRRICARLSSLHKRLAYIWPTRTSTSGTSNRTP